MLRAAGSSISLILAAAILGTAVGLATGTWIGWLLVVAVLAAQLAYHLRHLARLDAWSRQPAATAALSGSGVWDEIFARLYRHERDMQSRVASARQSAALYVAAGQALIDGLLSIDSAGRLEWVNGSAEQMLGLSRHTDLGKTLINVVRFPEFAAYLADGDYTQPLLLRTAQVPERVLSIHAVPYDGNSRRLLQLRDVTQGERLDQMRRDFVANVSHELRTPLTVLAGFVETLHDLELEADERNRYLALMTEQSERMERLLKELLMLSNLESTPPPMTGRVDMAGLLDKLVRDAKALSGGKHEIRLEARGEFDLIGAEVEICSALSNLVSNAVRYTPPGGSVTLRWRADVDGAEFSVTDTGIGIESKHIPRLTERFYRVDKGRSRATGGTGLGLAIVKHALSRHQASLLIESAPGKGSTFTARFPACRLVPPLVGPQVTP